jgi:hypothetical protein
MLNDDGLRKEFSAFQLSFINYDFMMFPQLDFVILDGLSDVLMLRYLLQAVQELQNIDAD